MAPQPGLELNTLSAPGVMALEQSLPSQADDTTTLVRTGQHGPGWLPDVSSRVSLTKTVALILSCVKQL